MKRLPATLPAAAASPGPVAAAVLGAVTAVLLGSVAAAVRPGPALAQAANPSAVTLVETAPVETILDHPEVPDAYRVWPRMMDGARTRLDVASFYFSNEPGSRLEPVIQAMEAAARRGVAVRVLSDFGFYKTYPQTLDRLERDPGVEVRLIDYRTLAGGVMHAKYFVVDGRSAYIGSQNMDWRSLAHIHEIGLEVELPDYAVLVDRVFEMDWSVAQPLDPDRGGIPTAADTAAAAAAVAVPPPPFPYVEASGDTARLWPAFSPRGFLPDSTTWDLPLIIRAMNAARDSVHVTVLTYSPVARDSVIWNELDGAFRRAAGRGVRVELMVADWSKRKPVIGALQQLVRVPGMRIRLVTIPQAKEGFIPFARVTHAKYMTVDGNVCWVGTGNWEQTYFYKTRNVGVIVHGHELPAALDRDFNTLWSSPYAFPVEPDETYTPPRVAK